MGKMPSNAHDDRRCPVRLDLGLVVCTRGGLLALLRSHQLPSEFIRRHEHGDWGEVCEEDRKLNEEAVGDGGDPRVLSVYRTSLGERLWLITEGGMTTLTTPDEY